jgi:hypothetical protein
MEIVAVAGIATLLLSSAASAQTYLFNAASFATVGYPTAVAAGDFNGDGKTDLAVACLNGNVGVVSVLLGNPDGSFQTHVDYATGLYPKAVVVADFDGDGKLDIATANNDDNSISILLGNGDGTFKPHVDYAAGNGPLSIVVGDFNHDGKLDLAVANGGYGGKVSIFLGNGNGSFQPHVDYPTSNFGTPAALTIGDFNNEGNWTSRWPTLSPTRSPS